jgi:molybdate transport system permease protein
MITELGKLDWSPLFISLKTGAAATVVAFFAGTLLSWRISRAGKGVKNFIDGVLTLPIVLPPTVAGFILLLVFSTRRPVGEFLLDNFNIKIIQSWLGCVVAAFVISFPLMYRNARAAFEQVDKNLIYAARTLGMSEFKILIRVVVPAASPGLISGTVLTFARAMGEYGATSMLAGNIPGKTATISQKIAMVIQDGNYTTAGIWVVIVTIISLVIIIATNAVLSKLMRR